MEDRRHVNREAFLGQNRAKERLLGVAKSPAVMAMGSSRRVASGRCFMLFAASEKSETELCAQVR